MKYLFMALQTSLTAWGSNAEAEMVCGVSSNVDTLLGEASEVEGNNMRLQIATDKKGYF
jgi:hypothetical protein